jgi:hypothetical protein
MMAALLLVLLQLLVLLLQWRLLLLLLLWRLSILQGKTARIVYAYNRQGFVALVQQKCSA